MTTQSRPALASPESALDRARRLELTDPTEVTGGATGRFSARRVTLLVDGANERLRIEVAKPLALTRIAPRNQDPASPKDVLSWNEQLDALVVMHAAPEHGTRARMALRKPVIDALTAFWKEHPAAQLVDGHLVLPAGVDAGNTLREAVGLLLFLEEHFLPDDRVPLDAAIALPAEAPSAPSEAPALTPEEILHRGTVAAAIAGCSWLAWALFHLPESVGMPGAELLGIAPLAAVAVAHWRLREWLKKR